jgi:MoaA/NifB/PqqE/SkfB family radical SAM enzyme
MSPALTFRNTRTRLMRLSHKARMRSNLLECARAIAGQRTEAIHRPTEAFVEIVSDCNLRCTMCALSFDPHYKKGPLDYRGQITREMFDRALPLLVRAIKVYMMGTGEPTMHRDLPYMVRSLVERGTWVTFNTNGTLIDETLAQELVDARLSQMVLSLDGGRAETFEKVRRGAKLSAIVENMHRIVRIRDASGQHSPEIMVAMVMLKENVDEIGELAELSASFGARVLHLEPLLWQRDPAYEAYYAEHFVPEEQARVAIKKAMRRASAAGVTLTCCYLDRRTIALGDAALPGPACSEPWTTVFMTREGKLRPCCNAVENLGDVNAPGGALGPGAWNSPDFKRYREMLLRSAFPEACTACARNKRYRRVLPIDASMLGIAPEELPREAR